MKSIQKYLLSLLAVTLIVVVSNCKSYGQSPVEFTCTVEDASTDGSNGKIYLSLIKGNPPFVFRLYDLYNKTYEFQATKEVQRMEAGNKVLVFDGLKPSTYVIQVIAHDSKWTLGGIEGFTVRAKSAK